MNATKIDQTVSHSHISVTQSPSSKVHYHEHLTFNERIVSSSKSESSHTDTASSMYEDLPDLTLGKPITLRVIKEYEKDSYYSNPMSFTNGFNRITEQTFRDYKLISYQTLRKEISENFYQFYGCSDDRAALSYLSHNIQLFIRSVTFGLLCSGKTKWEKYTHMKSTLFDYHTNFKKIMINLRDCMRLASKYANLEFLVESEAKCILSIATRMRLNILYGINRYMIEMRLKDIFFAYVYLKENNCVKSFCSLDLRDFIDQDGAVMSYPDDFLASALLLHLSLNPDDIEYLENEEIEVQPL